MAKARFIYNNLWRKGTIIDESTEAPQHPSTDTQIDTKSMVWRSTAVNAAQHISNKLGEEAKEYNFVALLNHNIRETATIEVIGANTDAFGDGDADDVITLWSEDDIFFFLPTARTKKYIKIKVTDIGNPEGYIQIGTVVCGKYFEPNCNFDWQYAEGDLDPSKIDYSDSMVVFAQEKDEIFRGKYLFASLDDTAAVSVQELITLCGIHKAFVMCFDYNNANTESRWVRLSGISRPKHVFHNIWNWDCPIEEIK